MLFLLVLSSLLYHTTCVPYDIVSDDDCYLNTTCLNVNYYLLNSVEYFTSNSKFNFLPGQHTLLSCLVIQNVINISLIGSLSNDKDETHQKHF